MRIASLTTARPMIAAIGATGLGVFPIWLLSGLVIQVGSELSFGESELGVAIALYFGLSALFSIPGGRFVEKIGWPDGVALTASISALTMLTVAVGAHSWPLVLAFISLGALANGMSQPAANLALARGVRLDRQGFAFGIKQAAMPVTTLVVGLSVPLVGATVGWRWAFAGAAGLAMIITVTALSATRVNGSERISHPLPAAIDTQAHPRTAIRRRQLLVLAAGAGLGTAATNSIGGFFVAYGISAGFTTRTAGLLLALGSIIGIASRLLSGFLADRRGEGHLTVVAMMMLGGAVGLVLLALGRITPVIIAGTILTFGLGWSWNGLFALSVVLQHADSPAAATGTVQSTKYIGGTAGPLIFGFVVQEFSYSVAWLGAATLMTAAAGLILLGLRVLEDSMDAAIVP